ncbi:4-alpha-glucanotransferase [Luteolibacter pohnpeiensis]|uniref:4-alpha-glucanotransferase n=1 Tax=Luteolibacter pohnpeiensis TaxID=454153 RepID=A0A934S436_9BACT|nr:4-alpha-glucanotransferase [Luteolibacter pohnpeiensis]MBK1881548.1 4-alpha-glucanotransferase [Luteolibacter pohnpeiensis]
MKVIFRLNYRTSPGQSLWLRLTAFTGTESSVHFLPLQWLNEEQWQVHIDTEAEVECIEYFYELHHDDSGLQLEEWGGPRSFRIRDQRNHLAVLLDTWCSPGTVDYALDTRAFASAHPFSEAPKLAAGNHLFQLRMSGVPADHVPCLLGSAAEIGTWNTAKPRLLTQTAENTWSVAVEIGMLDRIEYKYGLYDRTRKQLLEFEQGENRVIEGYRFRPEQQTRIGDEVYRRHPNALPRHAGVAIPVFSLRSAESLGVGEFADLNPLADWAKLTGLKLIQILPINDTTSSHSWTDSYPYSAISVFALHPIYLRVDALGFEVPSDLTDRKIKLNALPVVDYEAVMETKTRITREIYAKHREQILTSEPLKAFVAENRDWLHPYAVFCMKRDQYGTADFSQWDDWAEFSWERADAFVDENAAEIGWHFWIQFELAQQLTDAVDYLHQLGIVLKGDLPIGIDRESADAWSAPHLFKMDAQAGAPPDAFAARGQNWGFPTYDWEVMQADDFAWWRKRFAQLSRYFDAYRIDHILGFFRIWQVPQDQVEGIMGWFDPAIPIHLDEFRDLGIEFDHQRFCEPWLTDQGLADRFGEEVAHIEEEFFDKQEDGLWKLKEPFTNQRKIQTYFSALPATHSNRWLCERLMDCVSEVLFFEADGSEGKLFHPRCLMQSTRSYQRLDDSTREKVEALYADYFFRRQEKFWETKGYEKLPAMREASRMLLCGEDLGMVPGCVPGVLQNLGILTLEIQRMPKRWGESFSNPAHAPYLSVVSPSTHDMPSLRGWWLENVEVRADFAWHMLGIGSPPRELSGEIAARIIDQHLHSPAMWSIFPLQDLLALDETLPRQKPEDERINNPAINPFYWRYRMPLSIGELQNATDFNLKLGELVSSAGR